MTAQYQFLSPDQVEQFLTRGFCVVRNAFDRDKARIWTDQVFTRLGYEEADPSTWEQHRIHMPSHEFAPVAEYAPLAWGAMCELMGGEDRVRPSTWGNGFIVNLGKPEDADTWQPPSAKVGGWHKDGDFFRHFLDSPEQGLLTIVLWSDVVSRGGATFVAGDSVPVVARFLADHPEGVTPNGFGFGNMIQECTDFAEATGEVGDVYLLHPYILHASSQNALRRPRYITNPPVGLKEPMNFNRENPDDFSLIEQTVLRGLGVERLDFQPTAPRERIVPGSHAKKQEMLEAERARLAAIQ
ncbi:MAG: hypothetical protein H7Z41_15545 [Cytophagales bacterium]|nr:hypothetical protein [Armatimonadota bacterium]